MEFKQLRLFLAVCDAGSINEAARSVHLSQPALSRQIRLLEEDLGVALFERRAAGMAPTLAGARLREQARGLLDGAARVRAEITSDERSPSGEVAVAIPTSLRSVVLRPALASLASRYSAIRVRVIEGTSRAMRDALAHGEADLAIASTLEDVEFLDRRLLVREALFLIGPPSSEVLSPRSVSAQRIAQLPLALTARPNSLRTVVDREALGRGFEYQPRYEVQSLEMALELIDELGVFSVFPGSGVRNALADGRIAATRLRGLSLTWTLITSRERTPTTAARLLHETIAATVDDALRARDWPGAARPG